MQIGGDMGRAEVEDALGVLGNDAEARGLGRAHDCMNAKSI